MAFRSRAIGRRRVEGVCYYRVASRVAFSGTYEGCYTRDPTTLKMPRSIPTSLSPDLDPSTTL